MSLKYWQRKVATEGFLKTWEVARVKSYYCERIKHEMGLSNISSNFFIWKILKTQKNYFGQYKKSSFLRDGMLVPIFDDNRCRHFLLFVGVDDGNVVLKDVFVIVNDVCRHCEGQLLPGMENVDCLCFKKWTFHSKWVFMSYRQPQNKTKWPYFMITRWF